MDVFSLEVFTGKYDTEVTEMTVREKTFRFFLPRSLEPFIDSRDPLNRFPLWAKVWEASFILADFIAARPPDPKGRVLEIGGGIGLVSIVAAASGHRVTLTEFDDHALEFARANARLNEIEDLEIRKLDWHRPDVLDRYETVLASEVVYKESDFKSLERLFNGCLAPGGEIVLAAGMRNTAMAFFNHMSENYRIRAQKKVLRSDDAEDTQTMLLARMTPK